MTTVLLADDHTIIREGFKIYIKNILPHSIIEEAYDGDSVFEKIKHNNYSLIILDINMPDTDSFSLVSNILAFKPESKILIFSMNPEEMYGKKLLSLGVLGYLNKAAFTDEIKQAIENVINNKRYFSPSLSQALAEGTSGKNPANQNPFDLLSRRELEITKRLLKGETMPEIGSFLYLDTSTVGTDKERIFEKLHCKDIVEMNELALRHNFIQSN
jgi:two-component system, NarL family, invasion response regulator UvrY